MYLVTSASEFRHQVRGQETRVGACDIHIRPFGDRQGREHLYKVFHLLHLVDDDIISLIVNHHLFHPVQQVVRVLELSVLPTLHVDDENMVFSHALIQ